MKCMTLPNQITIGRILLIPFFVLFALYYGKSVAAGAPQEIFRWATIVVFFVAALSDALDGWIARQWNLRSQLGALLDPIADKGLMLTAIITLSVSSWEKALPIWFPILVIARDTIILLGCILINAIHHHLTVKPNLLGKTSTLLQMMTIALALLKWSYLYFLVYLTGGVTLLSGIVYVVEGFRLLNATSVPSDFL